MSNPVKPVFIVGSPRSGTSILTWCLGQHPNLLALEETYWLGKFSVQLGPIHQAGSERGPRSQLSSAGIERDAFYRFFGEAVNSLIVSYERRPDLVGPPSRAATGDPRDAFRKMRAPEEPKLRWVDGTPENSFYIAGLRKLFPEAKFIHLLRDVGAVVKSLMNFAPDPHNETHAYDEWLRKVRACVQAERGYGSDVVKRIRYEDLIAAPAETIGTCLEFIAEPYCDQCLEPLRVRINSSNVPPDFNPHDPATDPALRIEAEQLSQALLAEVPPEYVPEPAVAAEIEAEFEKVIRFHIDLPAERRQALAAMKEAQQKKQEVQQALARANQELAALRQARNTPPADSTALRPADSLDS